MLTNDVVEKIKTNISGKPAISFKTLTTTLRVLLDYGQLRWASFRFSKHDANRLKVFFDDSVKSQRLIKGKWLQRTWVGVSTLSHLIRCFLRHFIERGCLSWDVVIAKCLSVVLVASLGCRSGDIVQSNLYVGNEYLQWQHVEFCLEGGITFSDLRAVITLNYRKGYKDVRDEEQIMYLSPVTDVSCQHICPLTLLFIHALRHGLVRGRTIKEVLNNMAESPGRRLQWVQPSWPVACQFKGKGLSCELSKAARPEQLLNSIKEMGLISNILSRIYMHATRSGAARDLAHLPHLSKGTGTTTEEVRQGMGHTLKTMMTGTTESYVGGSSREFFNNRVSNKEAKHRREPTFSDMSAYQAVKALVT